jgi:hypothetical protein
MFEKFGQDVIGDSRTCMTQMRITINGGTADINSHVARLNGLEQLFLLGKGICYI